MKDQWVVLVAAVLLLGPVSATTVGPYASTSDVSTACEINISGGVTDAPDVVQDVTNCVQELLTATTSGGLATVAGGLDALAQLFSQMEGYLTGFGESIAAGGDAIAEQTKEGGDGALSVMGDISDSIGDVTPDPISGAVDSGFNAAEEITASAFDSVASATKFVFDKLNPAQVLEYIGATFGVLGDLIQKFADAFQWLVDLPERINQWVTDKVGFLFNQPREFGQSLAVPVFDIVSYPFDVAIEIVTAPMEAAEEWIRDVYNLNESSGNSQNSVPTNSSSNINGETTMTIKESVQP